MVGGTEAEAKAKAADYLAQSSVDGGLAHMSGSVGVDLGAIDLDAPLASLETDAIQGVVKGLIESAPDKSLTFRDLVRSRASGQFLTGTPEQIADTFQTWHEAGVDGFNIVYAVTPGTFADFIDGVVPELRRRGLVQSDYAPGTLREKLFGRARLPAAAPRRGLSTLERKDTMDADELRSLQAPLKERYREDTDAALIVLKASGAVDDSEIACSVDTGKALVEAGLHPSGGGTGLQACSGDMLLQALVACAGGDAQGSRDRALNGHSGRASERRRRSRRARDPGGRPRCTRRFPRDSPVLRARQRRRAGRSRQAVQAHRALLRRLPDAYRRRPGNHQPQRQRRVSLRLAGAREAPTRRGPTTVTARAECPRRSSESVRRSG